MAFANRFPLAGGHCVPWQRIGTAFRVGVVPPDTEVPGFRLPVKHAIRRERNQLVSLINRLPFALGAGRSGQWISEHVQGDQVAIARHGGNADYLVKSARRRQSRITILREAGASILHHRAVIVRRRKQDLTGIQLLKITFLTVGNGILMDRHKLITIGSLLLVIESK